VLFLGSAAQAKVLEEQFAFLLAHYEQALATHGSSCSNGKLGELCPSCLRFMELRDTLMEPFRVAPAEWKNRKAMAA
jgi:hypothetical protein